MPTCCIHLAGVRTKELSHDRATSSRTPCMNGTSSCRCVTDAKGQELNHLVKPQKQRSSLSHHLGLGATEAPPGKARLTNVSIPMPKQSVNWTRIEKSFVFLFTFLCLTACYAQVSIPQGFSSYASEPIGNGATCHAGAVLDEDGMNQKPFAYVEDLDHRFRWTVLIALQNDAYQARLTHCEQVDDALYVLMQADTQQQKTLSQTLLQVVKLNAANGTVIRSTCVDVPGVKDAYSAWADKGNENFQAAKDKVIISGHYFRLTNPGDRKTFEIAVNANTDNADQVTQRRAAIIRSSPTRTHRHEDLSR